MIRYLSICSGIEAVSAAWKGLDFEPVAFAEIEPFPSAILRHHYPDVPNLGDITQIDGTKLYGKVDMIVGGTPCFPDGTKILTPLGYRNIENISIGDQVISADGNICKVTNIGSKLTQIGKLEIENCPIIRCTPNHPFLSVPTFYIHSGNEKHLEWIQAEKTVDGYIASHKTAYTPMPEMPDSGFANEADILELAGWFVAIGDFFWDHKNIKHIKFGTGIDACYFAFVKRFKDIIPFSSERSWICLEHPGIVKWLSDNFCAIPYWLYTHSLKSCFLDGFFQAMKSSKKMQENKNESVIKSDCEERMLGLADLLIYNSCLSMEMEEAEPGYCIPVYTLHIPHESEKLTCISGRKLCKVKSYEIDSGKPVRVYNITVEKDHSYIVNGFAVHNCQDFSVAGRRKGLEGKRSGLAHEFIRLVSEISPRWFIWENVPGAFSTNHGRDFGCILNALDELRYGLAWRVLDAQYFGIPQRRRRIFLVGYLGDWRPSAKILFEYESLCRNTQKSRKKRQNIAGDAGKDSQNGMSATDSLTSFIQSPDGNVHIDDIAPTLRCKNGYPSERGLTFIYNQDDEVVKSHWDGGSHPCLYAGEHSGGIGMSDQELFSQKGACLVGHEHKEVLAVRTSQTSSNGHGIAQDKSHTLDTTNSQALFFAYTPPILEQALTAKYAKGYSGPAGDVHHNLVCVAFAQNSRNEVRYQNGDGQISGALGASEGMKQRTYLAVGDAIVQPNTITGTLMASGAGMERPMGTPQESDMLVLAMATQQGGCEIGENLSPTITSAAGTSGNNQPVLFQKTRMQVRRITPTEAERLMGFPDGYTAIEYKGKPAADGPRYKALGNSMAVPVMRWLGKRIILVDKFGTALPDSVKENVSGSKNV